MNITYKITEVSKLPDEPGVYKFYNSKDSIIYVGKAKSLLKRVKSYFAPNAILDTKTSRMIKQIKYIDFIIVNSEHEALLLENNLIKQNSPTYNILLKDDKTYPYLCITNERFPRLISTRQVDKNMGSYYGPFTSTNAIEKLLSIIKQLYKLRTCTYKLSEENISKKKFKVCLEYHIKNCFGPCEAFQSEESYNQSILQIKNILKGNINEVKQKLKKDMLASAEELNFEKAQAIKEQISTIETYQAKSVIINTTENDIDAFGIIGDVDFAFVNYTKVKNGVIVLSQTIELQKKLNEGLEDILIFSILYFREKYNSDSNEIITNIDISEPFNNDKIKVIVPKQGDKRKLVEITLKNALFSKQEKLASSLKKLDNKDKLLQITKSDLNLKYMPYHIECFDNSNIQGHYPVAAMVCFINGKPSKKDYRHYSIKTVHGPDDYASMYEVVYRRYSYLIENKMPLPNLVIIDGGKGQLNSAINAINNLGIGDKFDLISIAKKLELIYKIDSVYPIHLSRKSPSLRLLQRVRDETHRFAITFHRNKRSKGSFKGVLSNIKGLGAVSIKKIMLQFKTVDNIKNASLQELADVIGNARANLVMEYFKSS